MTTPSLTGFLLARIAEDEAVAKTASSDSPNWEFSESRHYTWDVRTVERLGSPGYEYQGAVTFDREGLSDSVALDAGPHIARFDPARVLAECEAKRQLIRMAYAHGATVDGEWGCCHDVEALHAGGRAPVFDGDEFEPLPADCLGARVAHEMLAVIALPYASHPDYNEAQSG